MQASAAASKLLNTALKAEVLVIAINRKSQPFPRLTAQDFKELAARAADIKKAETSAGHTAQVQPHLPPLVEGMPLGVRQ